jgi:excisionase family DNA binding protein
MNVSNDVYENVAAVGVTPMLLTVEQAALLLGLGRTSTYELVMRGLIQSVKIGRRRLVVREGLSSYISELLSSQFAGSESSTLQSIEPRASAAPCRSGSRMCP